MDEKNVESHPIVTDKRGEVGSLETVDGEQELGAVDSIRSRETTPWEQTHL